MKNIDYRYVIVCCIVFITIPISIKLFYTPLDKQRPALTINKKKISRSELNKRLSHDSYTSNFNTLVDSIIVKELLIQEAIKSGINKEKTFQESIRSYYEQSLIKLLMDRKYESLNPEIEPSLVKRYIELSDKTIHLTLLSYKTPDDFKKNKIIREKKSILPFKKLSTFLKFTFLSLKEGQLSSPIPSEAEFGNSENDFNVFRLDKIEKSDNANKPETDIEIIKNMLLEQKKGVLISEWITGLKNKARVKILAKPGIHDN